MDEPTNHLDLAGKEVLEEALRDYEGSLIIVTHDRYLMNRVAEITWEMENGNFIAYPGNYDLYLWRKQRLAKEEGAQEVAPKTRDEEKERKRREALARADRYEHKKALVELEKEIEAKEARKKEVEGLLADSKIYADGEQARTLVMEYQRLRDELDALYELYEEKEAMVDG
jgi:ATP-binding cassette subfamily F protein 3